jgi:hypothetical protein
VFLHRELEIPVIHYTFSTEPGSEETAFFGLRWLSITLIALSLSLLSLGKSFYKYLGVLILIPSFVILFLSGGRSAIATGALYLVLWLYFYSHKALLGMLIALMIMVAFIINVNPSLLKNFPLGVERSLSALVLNKEYQEEMFGGGAGSDDWHHNLANIGYDRWTMSPMTLLFGYGTRATSPMEEGLPAAEAWYRYALSAADTGSYENTLWDILCTTGLVGFFLYGAIFLHFLRLFTPYLRNHQPLTSLQDFIVWWAFAALVVNILTSPIAGGLPGLPLVLAALAEKIVREKRNPASPRRLFSKNNERSLSPKATLILPSYSPEGEIESSRSQN